MLWILTADNMVDTSKLFTLAVFFSIGLFSVNAGVFTFRVDEHEKSCFGYQLDKDSGEVSADIQVKLNYLPLHQKTGVPSMY